MSRRSPSPPSARQKMWLDRVNDALARGDLATAGAMAAEAVVDGIEHPNFFGLAASHHVERGDMATAEDALRRALRLAPRDPQLLNSHGVCLSALGRHAEALKAYDRVLTIDPDVAEAHFNRGATLDDADDLAGARAAYRTAIALKADYVEPVAALAWLDAKAGDSTSAVDLARRALSLSPRDELARMALASASLATGDLATAENALLALFGDPALASVNRAIVIGMMGDLLDAQGNHADAFSAYAAANSELRAIYAPRFDAAGGERATAKAHRLARWFEGADPAPWQETPEARPRAADPRRHVFLVGFPRSGTTLLERALAAHPDVVSLEEKPTLDAAGASLLDSDGGLERLAGLDSAEAHRLRNSYWKAVRDHGVDPRGKTFIDKMPLASVNLPLIAKLFPMAHILFALRDPRDVVLSGYRRRFGMNRAMFELLTLDGAAQYYDAVMRLADIYRGLLALPLLDVRYESLVEDFDGSTRAVCDFLGLDWSEKMADFAAHARESTTPSAEQVARGLNREGQGAWRRYRAQMEPILPMLDPWVERFGYDPD